MKSKIDLFNNLLKEQKITINRNFLSILSDFSYFSISNEEHILKIINSSKNKSKIVVIDKFSNRSIQYFIICIDKILFIIQIDDLYKIKDFFINNNESTIYILTLEIQKLFIHYLNLDEKNIKFVNLYDDELYNEQILNFNNDFIVNNKQISDFWKIIQKCFSSYLLQKSYSNSQFDRIKNCQEIIDTKCKDIEIKNDEYIEIGHVGIGSTSTAHMIYSIKDQKIYVLKKPQDEKDKKTEDLYKHEYENYLEIHHPLICQFYGTIKHDNFKYLVIEYIDGILLLYIDKKHFELKDKMKIIFELMIIIEYLHLNHFIYRDLKPNNFIINKDNDIILIDLDHMRKEQENYDFENATADFGHYFVAPEIAKTKIFSYESDIYSLGMLIYFIIFEKVIYNNIKSKKFPRELMSFQEICLKCFEEDPKKRPKISDLINSFYICYQNMNDNLKELKTIQSNKNIHSRNFFSYWIYVVSNTNPYSLNKLGRIYFDGKIVDQDIDQAIHYLSLSAEQNISESLLNLGVIYIKDEYGKQNISKAIHYYKLASKLNNIKACYSLGNIYITEEYSKFNLRKAIHYYQIAADQGDSDSQSNLGIIYFQYFPKYINKAIKYLVLAAENKNANAQFNLGIIYFFGLNNFPKNIQKGLYYLKCAADQKFINSLCVLGSIYTDDKYGFKDIKKGIYYYELASDQNSPFAQHDLAFIYYENNDIDKAIHYCKLSAEQGNSDCQHLLGMIYLQNKHVARDIDQAIHYFTLAANQGNSDSQYTLGNIFLKAEFIKQDINKAINYFTLAANQNDVSSQIKLGSIYYDGKYIAKNVNLAIYYFTLAAKQNNSHAQINLGYIFLEYEYYDITKSIYYFNLAAELKNPEAQFMLANYYIYINDIQKGIYYYELAAAQKYVEAQFNLGVIYEQTNYVPHDYNKAIYYYTLAANNNHPIAQHVLGLIYCEKDYVPKDINKGIHYYLLAAKQNFADSEISLGILYNEGTKINKDINKAIDYFTKAANHGNPLGYYFIGLYYYEGKIVKQDIHKAIFYFKLAANKRCHLAQNILGSIYHVDEYHLKNINKAIYYYTQASNQGYDLAQLNLFCIYFEQKNYKKALNYLLLSAKENIDAQFMLGFFYFYGFYVEKNLNEAIKMFKGASSFNHIYAKNVLAFLYRHGYGVQKNISFAIIYYNEAIEKGDEVSMFNLAQMYFYGELNETNYDKAIELLIKSTNKNFYYSKILLSLVLIRKLQPISFENIQYTLKDKKLAIEIYNCIKMNNLLNNRIYEHFYNLYLKYNFVYDMWKTPINQKQLNLTNKQISEPNRNKLDEYFYEGFDIDTNQ